MHTMFAGAKSIVKKGGGSYDGTSISYLVQISLSYLVPVAVAIFKSLSSTLHFSDPSMPARSRDKLAATSRSRLSKSRDPKSVFVAPRRARHRRSLPPVIQGASQRGAIASRGECIRDRLDIAAIFNCTLLRRMQPSESSAAALSRFTLACHAR